VAPLALRPLERSRHPAAVELKIPALIDALAAVASELRARAASDRHGCCGYFPALNGVSGIISDLPACREFATRLPAIDVRGTRFRFNFLRLSLVQQSADAAYHLDSDAATAITGDAAALNNGQILRLLLNLSTRGERAVHYLDVDPGSIELAVEGSYIRVADPDALDRHALIARIPSRRGPTVHGLVFASNRVLHSGVDDECGHFVAAYGAEADTADPVLPS
jgi:hypothetical protein